MKRSRVPFRSVSTAYSCGFNDGYQDGRRAGFASGITTLALGLLGVIALLEHAGVLQ